MFQIKLAYPALDVVGVVRRNLFKQSKVLGSKVFKGFRHSGYLTQTLPVSIVRGLLRAVNDKGALKNEHGWGSAELEVTPELEVAH